MIIKLHTSQRVTAGAAWWQRVRLKRGTMGEVKQGKDEEEESQKDESVREMMGIKRGQDNPGQSWIYYQGWIGSHHN